MSIVPLAILMDLVIRIINTLPDKSTLRKLVKTSRADLQPEIRAEFNRKIRTRLLEFLKSYSTVLVYVSKEPEADTTHLIQELINRGTGVVVPIIQRADCSLRLSFIKDPSLLIPGTFNVPEPLGNEIPVDPKDIGVVLIPLVGFDKYGNRLGYGAGYYDRFLKQNPHLVKIGIAYSCQQLDSIPSENFDVKMDYIITENKLILC